MLSSPISVDALTDAVEEIFVAGGFSTGQAGPMARVLVAGERDGCKSHGIYRIAGCLRTVKAGKANVTAVPELQDADGAIVRVDAKGGFANPAFELGVPVLAERAKALGFAAMAINDCVHVAALWPEVEALTDLGLAAISMCPSYSTVAPTGGREPLFGTNPFAFGWPRPGGNPYAFDFATSVAARGEVELHHRAGTSLPEGWAIDADGNPTTTPAEALEGALLPFGGHKGSAISTMIELLGGAMIGDLMSTEAAEVLGSNRLLPRHGELVLAFDPVRFSAGRGTDPFAKAEILFDAIVGQGARLPSQRRYAARAESLKNGIVLDADELAELARLAAEGLGAVD
ncbi:Ldh family oxidoreductase [Acuticoccus sp. M5D2P5]|uniref:Ldh family oxidoreductase n=1 Tax=Acuticoccus kalidii TaxID=2910977 RepID=UPI001F35DAB1|nr:Ldh family oxidoreductase [Acuticoccus kalidii]MCF3934762.1 Ldh family oxidoreductase [Acuticoccus kalidii]